MLLFRSVRVQPRWLKACIGVVVFIRYACQSYYSAVHLRELITEVRMAHVVSPSENFDVEVNTLCLYLRYK